MKGASAPGAARCKFSGNKTGEEQEHQEEQAAAAAAPQRQHGPGAHYCTEAQATNDGSPPTPQVQVRNPSLPMLVPESSKCPSQSPGPSLDPLFSLPLLPLFAACSGTVLQTGSERASEQALGAGMSVPWPSHPHPIHRPAHPSLVRPSPAPTLEYSLLLPFCPVPSSNLFASVRSSSLYFTSPRLWRLP